MGIQCGIALLYQKQTANQTINKIRCYLVDKEQGEDHYDLKARAERYFANHPEQSKELDGYFVVSWNTAEPVQEESTELAE